MKPAKKAPSEPTRARARTSSRGFTAEERAAMREHAQELRGGVDDGEAAVLGKIAELGEPDRTLAARVHALVRSAVPELTPRTWYGMPAYALNGSVICFFQPAQKFKSRYATLGFSDKARLDEGQMWPTSFALMTLTPEEEARIVALVRRAAG